MATRDVPLTDIVDNPFQPRSDFDQKTIKSLADEIEAEGFWNGSLQGRRNARGKVELVFGHRRLRALRLLKAPSVRVELLDLSDDQMALRALEENLQREGLQEFEKADAVKRAVELETQRRRENNESERGAVEVVAKRLGLAANWVGELCAISRAIAREERDEIAGAISATAAHQAKKWGGKKYVKSLVRQAKQAAKDPDGKVLKPTENTVAKMKRAVLAAPESDREVLQEKIFSGDLTTPEQVQHSARSIAASRVRREKEPPPDLRVVIVKWTHDLKDWELKLKTVLPYMDYVDEVSGIAKPFRTALERLIETGTKILQASEVDDDR